jgi:hypothetical protein
VHQSLSINALRYATVLLHLYKEGQDKHDCGTAFMFSHSEGKETKLLLVTNYHNVQGVPLGKIYMSKLDQTDPDVPRAVIGDMHTIDLTNFEKKWYRHPYADIAVMPAEELLKEQEEDGTPLYFKAISSESVLEEEEIRKLELVEEVVFIGYPSGKHNLYNYMPIIRRGISATAIFEDYVAERPSFLIDAGAFPGSSGSPVFLWRRHSAGVPTSNHDQLHLAFLGILSGSLYTNSVGVPEFQELPIGPRDIVNSPIPLGLGVVDRATVLSEFVAQR